MKATVNGKVYSITEKAVSPITFEVDGKTVILDSFQPRNGEYQILYNSKSYNAQLISYNEEEKQVRLKINEAEFDVTIKGDTDELLEKLGIGTGHAKVQNVKAPMPGLVIDIKVKAGDTVNKGDAMLVLEAMKMENIIKASTTATVKKVVAVKGTAVEKNQVLIEME